MTSFNQRMSAGPKSSYASVFRKFTGVVKYRFDLGVSGLASNNLTISYSFLSSSALLHELSRGLNICQSAVNRSSLRGELIAEAEKLTLFD